MATTSADQRIRIAKMLSNPAVTSARYWRLTKYGYRLDAESSGVNLEDVLGYTPYAYLFNGVRRALNYLKTPFDIIHEYFKLVKAPVPERMDSILLLEHEAANKILADLTIEIHSKIDSLPVQFNLYIGLSTLVGYPHMTLRTQDDDPRKWLEIDVRDTHSTQWWTHQFTELVRTTGRQVPKTVLGFAQFIASPWLWTTDGATTESSLYLDGKPLKTKFGAAVSRTPLELVDLVRKAVDANVDMKVFIKQDEKGTKRRLIANPSLGGYLLAAYIRYLLESIVGVNPTWMTASPNFSMDMDIINLLREGREAMPLDESKFDYHISGKVWKGFIRTMETLFPDNVGVRLFQEYLENTRWRFEDEIGPWLKGMPSGLALTSLVNTMVNTIKQKAIASPLHLALGDDVLLFPTLPVSLEEVSAYYQSFGAEVNVNKNWTSTKYGEFLRYIYSTSGRVGYPARIFSSLIWALDTRTSSPTSKLNELAEMWKQFYDRALLKLDEDVVASDLSRALSRKVTGFSSAVAKLWLHSPRIHGGFGKLPYNRFSFTWVADVTHASVYKGNKIRLPRAMLVEKSHLEIGRYSVNSGASLAIGQPYTLPPVTSMNEWEARLNREDIPKRGPLSSLALDVIPLPVIDFVSTAAMAQFANLFQTYAWPALHGNLNAVTSRLVRTSIWLANNVSFLLRSRQIEYYV